MRKAKKSDAKYRDKRGRFTTRAKFLRSWREPTQRRIKRERVEKAGRVGKSREWETSRFHYKYATRTLGNYDEKTIRKAIEKELSRKGRKPIAFYIHLEGDDSDGETVDMGTSFLRLHPDNAKAAAGICAGMAKHYEIDSITEMEFVVTWQKRRRVSRSKGVKNVKVKSRRSGKRKHRKKG